MKKHRSGLDFGCYLEWGGTCFCKCGHCGSRGGKSEGSFVHHALCGSERVAFRVCEAIEVDTQA
eukprot:5950821-Amphidinium_carterae.1